MAGYRITYDGSNIDRRDVPQATGNSSLTESVYSSVHPQGASNGYGYNWDNVNVTEYLNRGVPSGTTTWDTGINVLPSQSNYNQPLPNNDWVVFGITVSPSTSLFSPGDGYGGGRVFITANAASAPYTRYQVVFATADFPVGTQIQWEIKGDWGGNRLTLYQMAYKNSLTPKQANNNSVLLYDNTNATNITASGTHTMSSAGYSPADGTWLQLQWYNNFGGTINGFFDHFRVSVLSPSPINIVNTTDTAGVAPTGTTGVIETVSTDINGGNSVGPAKEFGIVAKHDGQEIAEASYLPSAENTEDARASVTSEKIITATDTSVTVEAFGLGGAERLEGGDTRIIVEDIEDTTENP